VNLQGSKLFGYFENCTFLSCRASLDGGAAWFEVDQLEFFSCHFFGNMCGSKGSAFYGTAYNSSNFQMNVTETTFSNGSAEIGSCYVDSQSMGFPVAFDCTNITGNSVSDSGSAVYFVNTLGISFSFGFIESNLQRDCFVLLNSNGYTSRLRCLTVRLNHCFRCRDCSPVSYGALFVILGDCFINDSVLVPEANGLMFYATGRPTVTFTNIWTGSDGFSGEGYMSITVVTWDNELNSPTVMATCEGPLSTSIAMTSVSFSAVPVRVLIIVCVCIGVVGVIVCIVGLVICCKRSASHKRDLSQSLNSMYAGLLNEEVGQVSESRPGIPQK
jgi:hypothetical protein